MNMVPDDVLLAIFDFCKEDHYYEFLWNWGILVRVCQRWRQVVFAAPLRLNLRIPCTSRTPVRKNLGIWPALPIVINNFHHGNTTDNEDNIISALKYLNRVCNIALSVTVSELEKIATVMQEPFPVLTRLLIYLEELGNALVLPAKFLGGSSPGLKSIRLYGIAFPALPTLLFSTSNLVTLALLNIPPSGYISPEAMVVGLAALPRLRTFQYYFQLASSRPDRTHLPLVTRTVLPALTAFLFKGASEYLEELVSRIDAPQLDWIYIYYLNQLVDFPVAQLSKFIDRSVGPKLNQSSHANVTFFCDRITFHTSRHRHDPNSDTPSANTTIFCRGVDWQFSHLAQVLSQLSATFSNVVHFKLEVQLEQDRQLEGTDDVEWLRLLNQLSTVKTLHVSQELAGHIALALEDIASEMVADVLPSLDLIYLEDQPASRVENFVSARGLSDYPVTVVDTERGFDERVETYISK